MLLTVASTQHTIPTLFSAGVWGVASRPREDRQPADKLFAVEQRGVISNADITEQTSTGCPAVYSVDIRRRTRNNGIHLRFCEGSQRRCDSARPDDCDQYRDKCYVQSNNKRGRRLHAPNTSGWSLQTCRGSIRVQAL